MALPALWDLLVVPKPFFESRRVGDLTLPALGAVLLSALASVVGLWAILLLVAPDLPADARDSFRFAFGVVAVVTFVATFVGWALVAGLIHLLVRNHAPRTTYGRTFAVVGLAAIVEVPAILLGFAETYVLLESVSFADPETAARELEAADGGASPLTTIVWIAVTLWKGYIWREGLRGVYDVTADRATLAAGVAVGISLLMVIWP